MMHEVLGATFLCGVNPAESTGAYAQAYAFGCIVVAVDRLAIVILKHGCNSANLPQSLCFVFHDAKSLHVSARVRPRAFNSHTSSRHEFGYLKSEANVFLRGFATLQS